MNLLLTATFLILTSLSYFAAAQTSSNSPFDQTAILWRGFQHKWSYNHRLSRLGDAVQITQCEPLKCYTHMIHSASTGTGPDKGKFRSYYSYASANNVKFKAGSVTFIFEGKEGEQIDMSRPISIPCGDSIYPAQNAYAVVLNGYDLVSLQKADKVQKFQVAVSDAYYETDDGSIKFDVDASLAMDCNSLECELLNNTYKYKLTVYYLVISGDAGYHASKVTLQRRYFWDSRIELNFTPSSFAMKGDTSRRYNVAIPAFKRLSITLDKPHWFIEWNTALSDIKYDTLSGRANVTMDFLFKQWTNGMQANSEFPKSSRFSFRKPGMAELSSEVTLIQFVNGCSKNDFIKGEINTPGHNNESESDATQFKTNASLMRICK